MSDLAPDESPPPRQVQPWTGVRGHVLVRHPGRQFCQCGWASDKAGESVEDHLAGSWPILMPRLEGETRSEWRTRVASAHDQAIETRERLWLQEGHDKPTAPGAEFAAHSDEYSRVDELATVLQWQLSQISTTVE